MSDLENLKQENDNLKKQLEANSNGVQTLLAQLDAHKQMLNEQFASSIQVRSNLVLYQKAHKEVTDKNSELLKQIELLNKELEELKTKPCDNPQE